MSSPTGQVLGKKKTFRQSSRKSSRPQPAQGFSSLFATDAGVRCVSPSLAFSLKWSTSGRLPAINQPRAYSSLAHCNPASARSSDVRSDVSELQRSLELTTMQRSVSACDIPSGSTVSPQMDRMNRTALDIVNATLLRAADDDIDSSPFAGPAAVPGEDRETVRRRAFEKSMKAFEHDMSHAENMVSLLKRMDPTSLERDLEHILSSSSSSAMAAQSAGIDIKAHIAAVENATQKLSIGKSTNEPHPDSGQAAYVPKTSVLGSSQSSMGSRQKIAVVQKKIQDFVRYMYDHPDEMAAYQAKIAKLERDHRRRLRQRSPSPRRDAADESSFTEISAIARNKAIAKSIDAYKNEQRVRMRSDMERKHASARDRRESHEILEIERRRYLEERILVWAQKAHATNVDLPTVPQADTTYVFTGLWPTDSAHQGTHGHSSSSAAKKATTAPVISSPEHARAAAWASIVLSITTGHVMGRVVERHQDTSIQNTWKWRHSMFVLRHKFLPLVKLRYDQRRQKALQVIARNFFQMRVAVRIRAKSEAVTRISHFLLRVKDGKRAVLYMKAFRRKIITIQRFVRRCLAGLKSQMRLLHMQFIKVEYKMRKEEYVKEMRRIETEASRQKAEEEKLFGKGRPKVPTSTAPRVKENTDYKKKKSALRDFHEKMKGKNWEESLSVRDRLALGLPLSRFSGSAGSNDPDDPLSLRSDSFPPGFATARVPANIRGDVLGQDWRVRKRKFMQETIDYKYTRQLYEEELRRREIIDQASFLLSAQLQGKDGTHMRSNITQRKQERMRRAPPRPRFHHVLQESHMRQLIIAARARHAAEVSAQVRRQIGSAHDFLIDTPATVGTDISQSGSRQQSNRSNFVAKLPSLVHFEAMAASSSLS